MISCDVLVIGAGPAGLCAAISAAEAGASVVILERSFRPGGQLVKQTHMFFGSERQYASVRGIDIPEKLLSQLESFGSKVKLLCSCTVCGIYEDGVVTALLNGTEYLKLKPRATVVATGAAERALAFSGCDLPGIYGAGAVQTLMNVHGVRPGRRVVMVGAGNIGLIVSYQLLQAGVEVACVLDAAPRIGGYLVHAAKLRRMGVPILTSHSVTRAFGHESLEAVEVAELDAKFAPIAGTERRIDCDVCCISVGLTPLTELLSMAGAALRYIPRLGGFVAKRDERYETTVKSVFTAGDASCIEEASAAMVEGRLAGLFAAETAGFCHENYSELKADCENQLALLRGGDTGKHIVAGLQDLAKED